MRNSPIALAFLIIVGFGLANCTTAKPIATRSGKLLSMAGEEAAYIPNLSDRLTRQLNIADLQSTTGQKAEAIKTLALAAATLNVEETDKKTIDDFGRIAGWTSVAQLSHTAGDDKSANDAYINAVEALHSVKPEVTRAQYVLSLSQVAEDLKGKEEAGHLLVAGAEWAAKISDANTRRFALTSFASALVNYDNLEGTQKVLRNEPDAAWRADTLTALASDQHTQELIVSGGTLQLRNAFSTSRAVLASPSYHGFNKDVRYGAKYRQEQLQQGLVPNSDDPTH